MRRAKLKDVREALANGGCVRFVWNTCGPRIISADGESVPLDGRTYQGFLTSLAPTLKRTEAGSVETKDLIIEWRKDRQIAEETK
jgi:hypothetical protein